MSSISDTPSGQAGDSATFEAYAGEAIPLIELFRDYYRRHKNEDTLRRFLQVPIAIRTRAALERELHKLVEIG